MIRINQVKISIDSKTDHKKAIAKKIGCQPDDILSFSIAKKSIDARKKDNIFYIFSFDVNVKNEDKILNKKNADITRSPQVVYEIPKCSKKNSVRPVIVGSGPAGLFCAYLLASVGLNPIVIERGSTVDKRRKAVDEFWATGKLQSNSNVQFGEGGAGTFSDGKLNTMVKDTFGRIAFVLKTFASFGANPEIVYINKPHIGTDVLQTVIMNMRNNIISLGADFMFDTTVTDIDIKDGKVCGVVINGKEHLETDTVVLAVGHSARDTFMALKDKLIMEPKAFAMGIRAEHKQSMIGLSQYGDNYTKLPAADYKLTYTTDKGRNVYSFCMCPGGYVVNASSEEGMLAVNGMSYSGRDGENANSAIVVNITPEDYNNELFGGLKLQRKLEGLAYKEGNGKVPVQTFEDFKSNVTTERFGEVRPNIKGEYSTANLRKVLPDFMSEAIIDAMSNFGKKINGFDRGDTVFSGIESRTSSPIRITRDENTLLATGITGLYPCGEGAGYAGGITSAAVDGIKVAERIIKGEND